MLKFAAFSAIALSAALATAAYADDTSGYYQVGYSHTDLSKSVKGFSGISLGAAFPVWKFVSLEGAFETGVGDKVSGSGVNRTKYQLDHEVGITLVASHALSNGFDIQGRLGFVEAKVGASSPTTGRVTQDASGPSIGVGLHYFPNNGKAGVALTYDHADFGDNSSKDDILRLAYVHKF